MPKKKKEYPVWICHDCGTKYGRGIRSPHVATYHMGECHMCGEKDVAVTEPRDYGHLKDGWEKHCV